MTLPRSLAALASVSCALAAGCTGDAAEGGGEALPAVRVRTATAHAMTLRPRLELVGTLAGTPGGVAQVCARVDGTVRSVLAREGDRVVAQAELVSLDDRASRAEAARSAGQVALQQALFDRTQRGPRPGEIEIARQQARAARLTAEVRRRQVEAARPLEERGEISAVSSAALAAAFETAKTEEAASLARLRLLEAGSRAEDIAAAKARLDMAKAEARGASLRLEFCVVRSPITGIVSRVFARPGMHTTPTTQVAVVVDTTHLLAEVRIPWTKLSALEVGSRADVLLPSLLARPLSSTIERLGGEAGPETGDVVAYVPVSCDEERLRPNMSCRVTVWLEEIPNAVVVPVEAVADRDGVAVVTAIRGGLAHETEVTTGQRVDGWVQVTEGLSPGDVVAVEGGYGLPEGCPVLETSAGSPPPTPPSGSESRN